MIGRKPGSIAITISCEASESRLVMVMPQMLRLSHCFMAAIWSLQIFSGEQSREYRKRHPAFFQCAVVEIMQAERCALRLLHQLANAKPVAPSGEVSR